MPAPTRQPTPEPDRRAGRDEQWWTRLRHSARALRIAAAVAPVAASTVSSVGAALLLPAPSRPLATLLWWVAVLGAGVVAVLVVRRVTVRLAPLATLLDLTLVFPQEAPSRFAIARQARSVDEALDVLEDLGEASSVQAAAEASLALVVALETHDSATRGHAERVRLLADLVGQELGVAAHERVRLRWAALLHDLGKLHVHGDILNKPGRPTDEEWEQLQRHPLEGDRLVQPLRPWLGDWVNAVVEHHERFDGDGYPHGRAGHDISLAGRIVGVVDAYETMTARRAYKQPMAAEEARGELVACAGGQFDPDIVRAFLSVSIPSPSRRTLLLGWLAQLPIVAWLGRLPRGATATMLGAGATTATLVASGLSPTPAPPVTGTPTDPPPVAIEQPARPPSNAPAAPDTGGPVPSAPDSADLTSDNPRQPEHDRADQAEPSDVPDPTSPPDETEDPHQPAPPDGPSPDDTGRSDQAHRRASHVAASTLYLGTRTTRDSRWLPLTTDQPADQDVPDPDDDSRPGAQLPTTPWRDGSGQPQLAWTLQVPTTAIASPSAQATLYLALDGPARPVRVLVELLDCAPGLHDCHQIATGEATTSPQPLARGWSEVAVQLGPVATLIEDGHVLTLVVSAPQAPDPPLLAMDTADTPSRLAGISLAPRNLLDQVMTAGPISARTGPEGPRSGTRPELLRTVSDTACQHRRQPWRDHPCPDTQGPRGPAGVSQIDRV